MPPKSSLPLAIALTVLSAANAAAKPPSAAHAQVTARPLQLHVPIARELPRAARHTYRLTLAAGDFVRIIVSQRGVDVAVSLIDSDGRHAIDVDACDDPFRPEVIAAIATEAGTYTVAVRRTSPLPASGRYAIELDARRPTSDADRSDVDAERAFERGRAIAARRVASAWPDAMREFEAAAAAFDAAGDPSGRMKTLVELANAQQNLGRAEAVETARQAEALARDAGDDASRAAALYVLGRAQERGGDLASALTSYETATSLSHSIGNAWLEATSLNTEGIIWGRRGDSEAAEKRFARALPLARASGNQLVTAFLLNNLGRAYADLGEREKALAIYEDALADARRGGRREAQLGLLVNLGNLRIALHHPAKAVGLEQQALAIARDLGDRVREATALNLLGIASYELGDYRGALDYHRQSLDIHRDQGDRSGQAVSLEGVGRALRRLGDTDGALTALRESLSLREALHERLYEADTLRSLAEVERDRGDLTTAVADVQQAVDLEEGRRGDISAADLRASMLAAEHGKYELLIDLLQQQHKADPAAGHDAEALGASERARARVLLESVAAARVDDPAASAPAVLGAADIQRTVLDDETVLLEFALGDQRSWLWTVTRSSIATTELPPRDVIAAAARRLYDHFTARQPRPHEPSAAYATRVQVADSRLANEAAAMSRMLFGGVAARLEGELRGKRLVIVASGVLQYLPFAALPVPQPGGPRHGRPNARPPELLVARHEIVMAPSASVIAALRRDETGQHPARGTVAIVADPVFDAGDPRVARLIPVSARTAGEQEPDTRTRRRLDRLPFSRDEATAIASLVDRSQASVLTGFSANRKAVLSGALSGYRIVHLATHGIVDGERPASTELILSQVDEHGAAIDGGLRLRDIYALRLDTSLVVLSACQTAIGKDVSGEGLIGLARAFMAAGAPRVVASLWEVSDLATAELMKEFYRGVLERRLTPAAALRAAQLAIARQPRWQSPFYWAGFVLQGDWK